MYLLALQLGTFPARHPIPVYTVMSLNTWPFDGEYALELGRAPKQPFDVEYNEQPLDIGVSYFHGNLFENKEPVNLR